MYIALWCHPASCGPTPSGPVGRSPFNDACVPCETFAGVLTLPPSLSAVYKGCTREVPRVHIGSSPVQPVSIPRASGVHPLYTATGGRHSGSDWRGLRRCAVAGCSGWLAGNCDCQGLRKGVCPIIGQFPKLSSFGRWAREGWWSGAPVRNGHVCTAWPCLGWVCACAC